MMNSTSHSKVRCQQRGIPETYPEYIFENGTCSDLPYRCTEITILKRDVKRITRENNLAIRKLENDTQMAEKCKGIRVRIVGDNNVTNLHAESKNQHRKNRRKRR